MRTADQLPTVARLRELFDYDPDTGALTRRVSRGGSFARANSLVNGYVVVRVDETNLRAHRVVWAIYTGAWPPAGYVVDHVNGLREDNRISNLRLCTNSDNLAHSTKIRSNKRSGLPRGVFKADGRFQAKASSGGKKRYLGSFPTAEEAAAAYRAFVVETRGEFAPAAYRNS